MKKRITSLFLALCLCLSMLPVSPVTAHAAEDSGVTIGASGLCEHHTEHTGDCGYTGGTEEIPCAHTHGEDCYTEITSCVHEHDDSCYPVLDSDVSGNGGSPSEATEPTECGHVCDAESGCITEELSCPHGHDGACGYVPAAEGHPCQYECADCAGKEQAATPDDTTAPACTCDTAEGEAHAENCPLYEAPAEPVCDCETLCTEDAINADCPVCAAEGADLTACMGEAPAQAEPECICETDDLAIHATNCPAYVAPENPVCTCAEQCTGDTLNVWCDVCGVQGAVACEGEDRAQSYAGSGTFGDGSWSWTLDDEGTLTITGTGDMPGWTDNTVDQRPWHSSLGSITKVVISDGVTSVGDFAFRKCSNLTSVNLPNNLTSIGEYAFEFCSSLALTKLPPALTSISYGAFQSCTNLALTELPSNLNLLRNRAFSGCNNLAFTELPAGITSIPRGTFYDSTFTSSYLTIHSGITEIVADAFTNTAVNLIFMHDVAPTLVKDGYEQVFNFSNSNCYNYIPSTGTNYSPISAVDWTYLRYWYNVNIVTEGSGTANASQTTIVKQGVDEVTLTATPQEGWHFKEWKAPDGITITDNKFIIPDDYSAKENITITAVFEEHSWSTDWTQGETTHWHACELETCDVKKDETAHTPSYTANGATITATCGDCQIGFGTATITADGGTYTGSAYTAAVSGTDTMENMTWNITYAVKDGDDLSSAPSDVGTHTASITIDGATASVDFTIARAEGSGTVSIKGWTYGKTASSPTPESSTNGTDNVSYLYTSAGGYSSSTAPTDAGDYKVTATFAETRNYKEHTASAEFTITKASLTMAAPPSTSAIEYGQALVSSSITGGTVNSAVSGGATGISGTWSWEDGSLRPGSVGNYTADAVFTAYDHENHDPLTVTGLSVTVSEATPNIVISADPGAQIPGKDVTVSVTVKNPHLETLSDAPAASLTYQIGNDTAQALTDGSFIIPEGTPTNTVITITATTPAESNYLAATGTATVIVTDCPHTGTTVLAYDTASHWEHCNRCGADIGRAAHSGGTATCTEQAECSTCGQPHGDLDSTNHASVSSAWSYDGANHWHDCACGAELDKEAHSGGSATCTDKAECSTCGQPHGGTDPDNHTGRTETRGRVDATTAREGYTGDTYCLDCNTKIATGTTIPKKPSGGGGYTPPSSSDDDDDSGDTGNDKPPADTPADPPATSVLVPVSGDENTIHVDAAVSDTKATIGHVDTPTNPDTGDDAPAYVTHTVQKGDTLWGISRKYGCTVSDIAAANSDLIKDPNLIHPGWQLQIPQGGAGESPSTGAGAPDAILPEDKKTGVYIVRHGDTLWVISKRYGCTVAEIVALNGELITDPDLIFAGWELKMPQD